MVIDHDQIHKTLFEKFHLIKLRNIDYRTFLTSDNPLAYALMAKMKWSRRDIVRMKADFLRLLLGTGVDPARQSLLVHFIETYMPLAGQQQTEFMSLVQQEPTYQEIPKMMTVYEQVGHQKGLEEGLIVGELNKGRATIERVLRKRFGSVPQSTITQIQSIDDRDVLDELLDQSLDAARITDIRWP